MKLGILGGSFNPVHLGHLYIAEKAISELKLDRVVMIPAYRSPFKLEEEDGSLRQMENSLSAIKTSSFSSSNNRILMLAAAIAGDTRFTIDDCEIRREGVSYTIHTLEDIIARYLPTGKPYLLIGDDLAQDFPKWRDSERILQLADIAVFRRLNAQPAGEVHTAGEAAYPYPHRLIQNEVMDISSRQIRQLIRDGGVAPDGCGWQHLVPAGAAEIIMGKRTETSDHIESSGQTDILRIEAAARETLSLPRFLHSRNTALLAHDLCRRFGLDPMDGYLAGIAHDLGKQLDTKQMIKLAKTDGLPITALEKDKPGLLHGRAAAVLLRERFCIHNKDILEAVALHTSGSGNMGALAKVVYIADKAEVSRNIDPALRKICYAQEGQETTLDDILFAVLKKTVSKLQSRELDLSEGTLRLLEKMKERNR